MTFTSLARIVPPPAMPLARGRARSPWGFRGIVSRRDGIGLHGYAGLLK